MVQSTFQQTGGDKMAKFLKEAGKGGIGAVHLGFIESGTYDDGTKISQVAADNEFGTEKTSGPVVPERPFFRQAIVEIKKTSHRVIIRNMDRRRMVINERAGKILGAWMQGVLQESIYDLREPPNSPVTIAMKGSSNPLIDTGTMVTAVTWRLDVTTGKLSVGSV